MIQSAQGPWHQRPCASGSTPRAALAPSAPPGPEAARSRPCGFEPRSCDRTAGTLVNQSNASSVTIHRALEPSWCPPAVTMAPFRTPTIETIGATRRRRPPIVSRRVSGSHAVIGPVMRNRRGLEDTMEVNDRVMRHLAVGRLARTAPRRIPRRHVARRGRPPKRVPRFPLYRPPDVPSRALLASGGGGQRREARERDQIGGTPPGGWWRRWGWTVSWATSLPRPCSQWPRSAWPYPAPSTSGRSSRVLRSACCRTSGG